MGEMLIAILNNQNLRSLETNFLAVSWEALMHVRAISVSE